MIRNVATTKTVQTQLKILENLKGNKSLLIIIVVIVLAVAILPSYYFYSQYRKTQSLLSNPGATTSAEAKRLVDEVGKLIVLPTNEQPTVATVSDVTKLADQAFFANAKNGDKVLIYTQAKKAILFRESINKIVEVAPVNLGSSAAAPAAPINANPLVAAVTPTPTVVLPTTIPTSVTVTIYNGTSISGLASAAESKIKASVKNADIAGTGDAKNTYSKTIVLDLSGNQGQTATQIATLLGGTVATVLPDGENKPTSDILVIMGSDFNK